MDAIDKFSAKISGEDTATIDPGRCALLVVDMVNDYLRPDGAMPVDDGDDAIAAAAELAEVMRAAGAPIVWVRPGHTESADGLFRKRIPHSIGEVAGAQVVDELAPQDGEKVIKKRRYSAFFATDLDLYLREHQIQSVVVCGVALNICVRSTVQDAFFNGYDVFVVEDASVATGPREHESTLYDIRTHFGKIVTVGDVGTAMAGSH